MVDFKAKNEPTLENNRKGSSTSERSVSNHNEDDYTKSANDNTDHHDKSVPKRMKALRKKKANLTCADCPAKIPLWLSFLEVSDRENDESDNRLVAWCCENCARHHHYELGSKRCTIKYSKMMHELTQENLALLEKCSNDDINSKYEATLTKEDFDKDLIMEDEEVESARRGRFIKHKYKKCKYCPKDDEKKEEARESLTDVSELNQSARQSSTFLGISNLLGDPSDLDAEDTTPGNKKKDVKDHDGIHGIMEDTLGSILPASSTKSTNEVLERLSLSTKPTGEMLGRSSRKKKLQYSVTMPVTGKEQNLTLDAINGISQGAQSGSTRKESNTLRASSSSPKCRPKSDAVHSSRRARKTSRLQESTRGRNGTKKTDNKSTNQKIKRGESLPPLTAKDGMESPSKMKNKNKKSERSYASDKFTGGEKRGRRTRRATSPSPALVERSERKSRSATSTGPIPRENKEKTRKSTTPPLREEKENIARRSMNPLEVPKQSEKKTRRSTSPAVMLRASKVATPGRNQRPSRARRGAMRNVVRQSKTDTPSSVQANDGSNQENEEEKKIILNDSCDSRSCNDDHDNQEPAPVHNKPGGNGNPGGNNGSKVVWFNSNMNMVVKEIDADAREWYTEKSYNALLEEEIELAKSGTGSEYSWRGLEHIKNGIDKKDHIRLHVTNIRLKQITLRNKRNTIVGFDAAEELRNHSVESSKGDREAARRLARQDAIFVKEQAEEDARQEELSRVMKDAASTGGGRMSVVNATTKAHEVAENATKIMSIAVADATSRASRTVVGAAVEATTNTTKLVSGAVVGVSGVVVGATAATTTATKRVSTAVIGAATDSTKVVSGAMVGATANASRLVLGATATTNKIFSKAMGATKGSTMRG